VIEDDADKLSEFAIQALAKGFRESAIERLTLAHGAEHDDVPHEPSTMIQWLYLDVVQTNTTIQQLRMDYHLGNTDVRLCVTTKL
jgi:hypothetical protein